MALLDIIRKSLENARAIPGKIGIRKYAVYTVQKVSASPSFGDVYTSLPTTTYRSQLGCYDYTGTIQNPMVDEIYCNNLFSNAGNYETMELVIGPLTKNFIVSNVPGGYLITGLSPAAIPAISGTSTITKVGSVCSIVVSSVTGLIVGQGITISNTAHADSSGIFTITVIDTEHSKISYSNSASTAETCSYVSSGTQEMHIEVTNTDDNTTDKYYISNLHEHNLTHIELHCKKITGDAG